MSPHLWHKTVPKETRRDGQGQTSAARSDARCSELRTTAGPQQSGNGRNGGSTGAGGHTDELAGAEGRPPPAMWLDSWAAAAEQRPRGPPCRRWRRGGEDPWGDAQKPFGTKESAHAGTEQKSINCCRTAGPCGAIISCCGRNHGAFCRGPGLLRSSFQISSDVLSTSV
jgi:hypothetical protein